MASSKCPYRANHECKQKFGSYEAHTPFCTMCLQGMKCDEIGLLTSVMMEKKIDALEGWCAK
jgi:hypothetical protein